MVARKFRYLIMTKLKKESKSTLISIMAMTRSIGALYWIGFGYDVVLNHLKAHPKTNHFNECLKMQKFRKFREIMIRWLETQLKSNSTV